MNLKDNYRHDMTLEYNSNMYDGNTQASPVISVHISRPYVVSFGDALIMKPAHKASLKDGRCPLSLHSRGMRSLHQCRPEANLHNETDWGIHGIKLRIC